MVNSLNGVLAEPDVRLGVRVRDRIVLEAIKAGRLTLANLGTCLRRALISVEEDTRPPGR